MFYIFRKPHSELEKKCDNIWLISFLLIMLIYLPTTIHFYFINKINLHCLIFGYLIFHIFYSIILYAYKTYFYEKFTLEQKALKIGLSFVYLMIFWLYDILYLTIALNDWYGIIICGLIIIVFQSVLLVNMFLYSATLKENEYPFNTSILIEFLIIVGISIFLIYIIPFCPNGNKKNLYNLQQIIYPIVAAIYGGFITLTGVAWTIKKNAEDKKKGEIAKAKPYFCINLKPDYEFDNDIMSYVRLLGENTVTTNARFKNSDTSNFYLKRLYINGKWYTIYGNTLITTNQQFQIYFNYVDLTESSKKSIAYLEVQDILDNLYYYILAFSPSFDENVDKYNILLSCNEILKDNIPKECWEKEREVPFGNNKEAEVIKNNKKSEEQQC